MAPHGIHGIRSESKWPIYKAPYHIKGLWFKVGALLRNDCRGFWSRSFSSMVLKSAVFHHSFQPRDTCGLKSDPPDMWHPFWSWNRRISPAMHCSIKRCMLHTKAQLVRFFALPQMSQVYISQFPIVGQGEGSSYLDVLIENFTGRGWGKKLGWTLSFIIFFIWFFHFNLNIFLS